MQINIRSCPSVRWRWLYIRREMIFSALLWIETKWRSIKKRQYGYYSAFLTKHAWSIKYLLHSKNISLGQKCKMTHFSQELEKKANCVCNTSTLTVSCRFWRLHRRHCTKVKNLFPCSGSKKVIPSGKDGSVLPVQVSY